MPIPPFLFPTRQWHLLGWSQDPYSSPGHGCQQAGLCCLWPPSRLPDTPYLGLKCLPGDTVAHSCLPGWGWGLWSVTAHWEQERFIGVVLVWGCRKGGHPSFPPSWNPLQRSPVTPPCLVLCQWQEAGLDSGATWPAHSWGGGGTLCSMIMQDFPSAANAHPHAFLPCMAGLVPYSISHVKPFTSGSASLWCIMGLFPRGETSLFFCQVCSAPHLASVPL